MTTPRAGAGATGGVQMAILASRMESIVRKMTNTVYRTSRSGVINNARDCSCVLLTAAGDILISSASLPLHGLSGPDITARYMASLHPELKPGDGFLHNSPFHGNSHAADHTFLAPVVAGGKHRFTAYVKVHVADCGNSIPTTLMATARDMYQEGALIFPCVQVQEGYRDREDILRICEARLRVPELWRGDYLAMLGAARIGERELLALGEEVGWDALDRFTDDWFDYSERRMADAIRALPAGRRRVENRHDPVPGYVEGGVRVVADVTVDPDAATIAIDMSEGDDCVPCGINLTEATARSSVMVGVFNSVDHDVPKNAGAFRRLNIVLREGCASGIPVRPYSTSVATTGVADRVANAVQRAISEIAEGAGMAESGCFGPASSSVVSGQDSRRGGKDFVNFLFLGSSTGGGHPANDGWLTLTHTGNGGMMLRDSVEIDELQYPIRIWVNGLEPDSEGAGRMRGAPQSHVEWGPAGDPVQAVWCVDAAVHAPAGARGGRAGLVAQQHVRTADGTVVPLDPMASRLLRPGDVLVSTSSSGGGYGDPLERDPQAVAADVLEGYVSRERARDVYGVLLHADGSVDVEATRIRRAECAA